jgi:hypothetical protein
MNFNKAATQRRVARYLTLVTHRLQSRERKRAAAEGA